MDGSSDFHRLTLYTPAQNVEMAGSSGDGRDVSFHCVIPTVLDTREDLLGLYSDKSQ